MSGRDDDTQGASSSVLGLTGQDKEQLLSLAHASVKAHLQGASLPLVEAPSTVLGDEGAAFVSIYNTGTLRGCIGTFAREAPLWQVVQRMSVMAAIKDPRFPPVSVEECDDLSFELSLLSKPLPVRGPEDIDVGRHGLVVSDPLHRGVLLPQVATKYDWDAQTFLEHTCLKAKMPPEAWRRDEVLIEVFEAEIVKEGESSMS